MSKIDKIGKCFERNTRALTLRSDLGRGTAVTKVRLRDGLTCDIQDGDWKLTTDMAERSGGDNRGPNPGILGRGALGACLAMSYTMWATQLGISIDSLEVEIQADYDVRGHYGLTDAPPGYSEIRYVVTIESDADERDIEELLNHADAHTPYHDVFSHARDLRREVRILASSR